MRIWVQETELGALLISQTLLREGLIELNGSTVDLKQTTCRAHRSPSAGVTAQSHGDKLRDPKVPHFFSDLHQGLCSLLYEG